MPPAAVSKDEIVDRLFNVFRDQGFEGASLADLSRATGLGKSSLYHHFPNGKEQMAKAVLERATAWIDAEILAAAQGSGSLKARVRRIVATFDKLYSGGRSPCVLGQLAGSEIGAEARQDLRKAFAHWIGAIEVLARDSGMPPVRARHFAEDWVALVQGVLTLQAASGDAGPFKRAMNTLLDLTKDETSRS
ncbi:TetR/AcrR family transcriptional regulator [Paraburkholderia sp. USG1]|uniref:TetR/AcrR family transcriptional regulator n=1 Tax=Paraburkholderia sp. USG1 TaxID=2952268 RepID=UPI0028592772|nr:TetR/AcrR family transcriptional regulator [Paraburkholderia sp. USG1]MDR8398589.1 TetR/AcrR family transcriptional regulator [Paraburkholderia sp. USG1]